MKETYAYWRAMAEHHAARMDAIHKLPSWRHWQSLSDERMLHWSRAMAAADKAAGLTDDPPPPRPQRIKRQLSPTQRFIRYAMQRWSCNPAARRVNGANGPRPN